MRTVPHLAHLPPPIGNSATRRSQSFTSQLLDYGLVLTGKDRSLHTGEDALLSEVCMGTRLVGAPLGVTILGHRDDHHAAPASI